MPGLPEALLEININDINHPMLERLHFLSRHLPFDRFISESPAKTFENVVGNWLESCLVHSSGLCNLSFGWIINDKFETFFEDSEYSSTSEPEGLAVTLDDCYWLEFPVGPAVLNLEKRHPGMGRLFLELLNRSEIMIATPSTIYELACYVFWNCEGDEESLIAEFREENPENYEHDVEESIPVKIKHFIDAFPKWAFDRSRRKVTDKARACPIPELEPLLRLREQIDHFKFDGGLMRPNNSVPAILLNWSEQADDLVTQVVDTHGTHIYEYGSGVSFSSFAIEINGKEGSTLAAFQLMELHLKYFDECIATIKTIGDIYGQGGV